MRLGGNSQGDGPERNGNMWYEDPRDSKRDKKKDNAQHKVEEVDVDAEHKKDDDPDQSYTYTDWASI